MNFKTEQKEFWFGKFGDEYVSRNSIIGLLGSNLNFFQNFNQIQRQNRLLRINRLRFCL